MFQYCDVTTGIFIIWKGTAASTTPSIPGPTAADRIMFFLFIYPD